jgi:hypothetical protein
MTNALQATWSAIRRHHHEVPSAVITVSAKAGGCGTTVWSLSPGVQLSAETVAAGPRAVLEALLHQAAHGVVAARGESDLGNRGRYHTAHFRSAAEELGLAVSWTRPGVGFAETSLPDATAAGYEPALGKIATALAGWEPPPVPPRSVRRYSSENGVAATCSCSPPRKIRLRGRDAAEDLASSPIVCTVCGAAFKP